MIVLIVGSYLSSITCTAFGGFMYGSRWMVGFNQAGCQETVTANSITPTKGTQTKRKLDMPDY